MYNNRLPGINRREFLKRTGGIAGSAAGLSGTQSAGASTGKRILGRTGLTVSTVGYGTTESANPGVLKRALDLGVTFIDTGRMYANGRNEEMIGGVVAGIRKNLVIQTKFRGGLVDNPAGIERSIEESLRALRTDFIDILLLHAVSSPKDVQSEGVMTALGGAKEKGTVRFTGFSSHTGQTAVLRAAAATGFYDVAMVAYNHAGRFDHTVYKGFSQEWNQKALEEEMTKAAGLGMGIVAMKTCSGGPRRAEGADRATFPDGLTWILRNANVATMAVWMGNYREADEDCAVMD